MRVENGAMRTLTTKRQLTLIKSEQGLRSILVDLHIIGVCDLHGLHDRQAARIDRRSVEQDSVALGGPTTAARFSAVVLSHHASLVD